MFPQNFNTFHYKLLILFITNYKCLSTHFAILQKDEQRTRKQRENKVAVSVFSHRRVQYLVLGCALLREVAEIFLAAVVHFEPIKFQFFQRLFLVAKVIIVVRLPRFYGATPVEIPLGVLDEVARVKTSPSEETFALFHASHPGTVVGVAFGPSFAV